MIDTTIRRTVDLDASADELWRLVSDPAELATWLGADVELALVPGATGRVTDLDGSVRRVVVDTCTDGTGVERRQVGFTWWRDGDESTASIVTLTVERDPAGTDGRSRLTVVEQPVARAGGRTCQASVADVDAWERRLVGLELAVFTGPLVGLALTCA